MPKKTTKTAASASVPKKQARANRPKDPVKSKAGKASAAARKAKREAGDAVKRPCSARRTDGTPCKNSAIRGGTVCSRHGGSAPQVREKANQRLLEMVMPAMRELRKIIDSKTATDADKLRAVAMVLNRTGYSERATLDIGLRAPTEWDQLFGEGAVFSFDRSTESVTGGDRPAMTTEERRALDAGGPDADEEALDEFLARRSRDREKDTATRLDNRDHPVVTGDVVSEEESELFGFPVDKSRRRPRPTEHDGSTGDDVPTRRGSRLYENGREA